MSGTESKAAEEFAAWLEEARYELGLKQPQVASVCQLLFWKITTEHIRPRDFAEGLWLYHHTHPAHADESMPIPLAPD